MEKKSVDFSCDIPPLYPKTSSLQWYRKRLGKMSPTEIIARIRDQGNKVYWRTRQISKMENDVAPIPNSIEKYQYYLRERIEPDCEKTKSRITQAADSVLAGRLHIFSQVRTDMVPTPDWFIDIRSGIRAPQNLYAFAINHRSEEEIGNIKYIWELSRHQYLTLLASAFYITNDSRYSQLIIEHLRAWWNENPFLSGPHWISGIEIGIRLISWVWIRRFLNSVPEIEKNFEENPAFLRHLMHHQEFLNTFMSHGSSANNHLIAEAVGLFVASCNFPYFSKTQHWRKKAAHVLEREMRAQTFPSGVNRELATAYHNFVLELALVAGIEGEFTGNPIDHDVWRIIRGMMDALASIVDTSLHPPRQGDADDGMGLLVDSPEINASQALLATGKAIFQPQPWWPSVEEMDFRTLVWSSMVSIPSLTERRPEKKRSIFPDAGMVILRGKTKEGREIWCRCDHGPHGFLAIAAHAHADALSIEVRIDGVELLVDPGTYCYHGNPSWRSYFRSTIGHNTLELGGFNQVEMGGPFMWDGLMESKLESIVETEEGNIHKWSASHNGFHRLRPGATHYRTVSLDSKGRFLLIEDMVRCQGTHPGRLAFHLGPSICCDLQDHTAQLRWEKNGTTCHAQLRLPNNLEWSVFVGSINPILGWYSPAFDAKIPTHTLIGKGLFGRGQTETSQLWFEANC